MTAVSGSVRVATDSLRPVLLFKGSLKVRLDQMWSPSVNLDQQCEGFRQILLPSILTHTLLQKTLALSLSLFRLAVGHQAKMASKRERERLAFAIVEDGLEAVEVAAKRHCLLESSVDSFFLLSKRHFIPHGKR